MLHQSVFPFLGKMLRIKTILNVRNIFNAIGNTEVTFKVCLCIARFQR